ncbi:hypothetical protein GCM10022221_68020 [Actinocorallia aurea]
MFTLDLPERCTARLIVGHHLAISTAALGVDTVHVETTPAQEWALRNDRPTIPWGTYVTELRLDADAAHAPDALSALWLLADEFREKAAAPLHALTNPDTGAEPGRFPDRGAGFALADWVSVTADTDAGQVSTTGMEVLGLPNIRAFYPDRGELPIGNLVRAYAWGLWALSRGARREEVTPMPVNDIEFLGPRGLWQFWGATPYTDNGATVGLTAGLTAGSEAGHIELFPYGLNSYEVWADRINRAFPPLLRPYTARD